MSVLFNSRIITNIFRTPFLRNILLVYLAIAILFPAYGAIFEIPQFTKMVIENTKNDTTNIGEHLIEIIFQDNLKPKRDFLSNDVIAALKMAVRNFQLEKIILFSESGKIIYSTDRKEIGNINRKEYFREIVSKGNIYSTLAQKEIKSSEGRIVTADVLETYLPIMDNGKFHGAFEIYYDITDKKEMLYTLLLRSMLILFALALIILIAVTLFLLNTSKINLERGLKEEKLLESEEKYRSLYNNVQVGLGRTKISDGKVLESNEKMAQIFGFSNKREFIKKFIFSENCVDPGVRKEMINEGKKSGKFNNKVAQFYRKDGGIVWVRFDSRIYHEKGYIEDVVVDITEQKEAEEERSRLELQLQQAQKMEAIGTLAGGIAHNFNNLLMGMQGYTSLMLINIDPSHPHLRHLRGIEENVKSAAGLTRQLLGFARSGKYEIKPTNLTSIINDSSEIFGRAKKEITIHREAQKKLWAVEVDQTQIEQVLLNLYINAWQAISGTGELHLKAENVTLNESFAKRYDVKSGKYVKISVTDTGIGMDKATQQRIFDPFFTTKEKSKGTGLGLASAYGIIRSHGGAINVYSEIGKGATFNIYLPKSQKEVKKKKEISGEVIKGAETLLLIDDEESIIEVCRELLENLGYTVLSEKGGKEAIATYQKDQDRIDGVILDMIMPVMGGSETYDRLKAINPDIKVLLASGYSIKGLAETILAKGCDGFIQKPFDVKELSQKLREILDKE